MAIYTLGMRFPELAPPDTARAPVGNEVESGIWCYPDFCPDESFVTILPGSTAAMKQFAAMPPEYAWFENEQQVMASVASPHQFNPNDAMFSDLRRLFGHFLAKTELLPRIVLKEGRLWPPELLTGTDEEIIKSAGELPYLQVLAERSNVQCLSAEPVNDTEMIAATQLLPPHLGWAVPVYINMRMLPQMYKKRINLPSYDRLPLHNDLREFVWERQRLLMGSAAYKLYPKSVAQDRGGLNSIASHLSLVHKHPTTGSILSEEPNDATIEQIFQCINSPVFHSPQFETNDLCAIQKVSVFVNRLRDRRAAYLRTHLARLGISYFAMSSHIHHEVLLPSTQKMAAERRANIRELSHELGLRAIRPSFQMTDLA